MDEKSKLIFVLEELNNFFDEQDGVVGILVGFPTTIEYRDIIFEKL